MARRTSCTAALLTSLATAVALAAPLAPGAAAPPSRAERAPCDPFRSPIIDPDVPTSQEVIGLELGDRDVTTRESDTYLRAVADASPRVVDGVLGRSWEGRPLRYAVVGKAKWVRPSALRTIGRDLNKLRDADTSPAAARRIVKRTPAVLWVAGNVHGGEESGTDATLRVLYELAARRDCTTRTVLDRAIVVVLPTQNPDGREADTRRNAYGFDLNRDWFARTQRETDSKVEKLRELPPQLFIDSHEMGRETYFFPPNADPVYHDIGETPLHWIYEVYGPAMQDVFDRFSIPYFNGDVYDLFYMGYGDTVPATGFNAAGMTYEKANGDPAERRVQEQYTAIWTTLMAAGERHSMLREWRAEHVKAAQQGRRGQLEPNQLYWEGEDIDNPVPRRKVRHYFLTPPGAGKQDEQARLVERLRSMDVDVYRLAKPLRVPGYRPYGRAARTQTLPKGTYWIPMAQGQKHWVQAMLNEDTYVPFPYFYDVTAFSGPLLNNVPGGYTGATLEPRARLVRSQPPVDRQQQRRAAAPRLGVWQVSEEDTSAIESAGWLRWWLDRRQQLLYSDLTAADIGSGALDGLDVLVVPNGDAEEAYEALGDAGRQALTDWVDAGGTLVTLRGASLLASRLGLTTATAAEPTSDVPGSLIRVELDARSPLSRGVGRTAYAMYEYDLVWNAPADAVPVRYPMAGDPDWFVSGFAQGEEELHGTAAVVDQQYGDGRVVLFGSDPNFRAFTDGTAAILENALLGPEPSSTAVVAQRRAERLAERSEAVQQADDRMVLTVRPEAADEVRALLAEHDADVDVVRDGRRSVGFRVDLRGMTADDHPWAVTVAQDVAELGEDVVALRLP
ncbi:M14 family zinc carboxypeptidase [Nocardioides caldifontis]|uniref:M14 family zinc carboxypeptidase n=1 Tax=Nocardioides caldifontis TaxID=2588938 RepID=UPI0011DF49A8|nr:M14 family zinc carboxypeptidase [Nocardioides caldifontis]